MKTKKIALLLAIFSVPLFVSCASANVRQISPQEREDIKVIGNVSAEWLSFQFLHIPASEKELENKAVSKLKAEAQKQGYKGNIDIRNINIAGSAGLIPAILTYCPCFVMVCHFQTIVASGDVVEIAFASQEKNVQEKISVKENTEVAVLPPQTLAPQDIPKIAVYVASSELKDAEKKMLGTKILATFVQSKRYRAIERSDAFLSGIARERQKQRDGSVDDGQISRLGKEAGVQFVCVADLVDAFGVYSVSARLIDTETAEIVGIGETEMKNLSEIGSASDEIFRQISGAKSVGRSNSAKEDALALEKEKQKNDLELEKQRDALELEKQRNALELEKQKNSYKNFTSGQRWGTFALNILPGVGSIYIMNDWTGAIIQWVLAGTAVIAGTLVAPPELECSGGYNSSCEEVTDPLQTVSNVALVCWLVYDIYRSASYDKPNPNASLLDPRNFNLAILPNKKGNGMAYGLRYNLGF